MQMLCEYKKKIGLRFRFFFSFLYLSLFNGNSQKKVKKENAFKDSFHRFSSFFYQLFSQ